jgi:N-acetylneuraminate epimerase
VTTNAVVWGDDIILSNGEIKPGVRTPNIMLGKITY